MIAVSITAVEVECPVCGALPLFECLTNTGQARLSVHVGRQREAERLGRVLVEGKAPKPITLDEVKAALAKGAEERKAAERYRRKR